MGNLIGCLSLASLPSFCFRARGGFCACASGRHPPTHRLLPLVRRWMTLINAPSTSNRGCRACRFATFFTGVYSHGFLLTG